MFFFLSYNFLNVIEIKKKIAFVLWKVDAAQIE